MHPGSGCSATGLRRGTKDRTDDGTAHRRCQRCTEVRVETVHTAVFGSPRSGEEDNRTHRIPAPAPEWLSASTRSDDTLGATATHRVRQLRGSLGTYRTRTSARSAEHP